MAKRGGAVAWQAPPPPFIPCAKAFSFFFSLSTFCPLREWRATAGSQGLQALVLGGGMRRGEVSGVRGCDGGGCFHSVSFAGRHIQALSSMDGGLPQGNGLRTTGLVPVVCGCCPQGPRESGGVCSGILATLPLLSKASVLSHPGLD